MHADKGSELTCVVGGIPIGGGHPVVVQSMTDTDTADVEATVAQVKLLADAGSEIVRITVNNGAAADAGSDRGGDGAGDGGAGDEESLDDPVVSVLRGLLRRM